MFCSECVHGQFRVCMNSCVLQISGFHSKLPLSFNVCKTNQCSYALIFI